MRAILRVLGILFAVVLVAGALFVIPTWWGKPWMIDHFYGRVFLQFALRHPMLLSQLRILEPMGIEFHSGKLDDLSMEAQRREIGYVKSQLATLRQYDASKMTPGQKLSRDVLEYFLADQVAAERFQFHDYPVNQLFGIQSQLPDFMVNTHALKNPRDAENYLRRVAQFGRAFDQVIAGLDYRAEHGVIPPRFVLARVREEIAPMDRLPARENVLFRNFDEKTAKIEKLSGAPREKLLSRLEREIDATVKPAYRRLDEALARLEARATDDDGVWKLPDGDAYYTERLKSHTTTDLSADSIHALGLREIARLHDEMRTILAGEGIRDPDPAAALQRLSHDPRFHFSDGEEGRKAILAEYDSILAEAKRGLSPLFDLRPKAKMEVRRIPEFKEATAPGAYYDPPAFDGSRPGVFYANLRSPGETVRYDMRTLAYHEGIPGHHFQIAIAQELKGVPFFRRIIPFTAYSEGWGLYAERLALENGFHRDPYSRLGALQAELFRATRLVVDTGIHRKRWTRREAIDFMTRATGMPESEVTTEIERYIVMPGQACAYKVGQLEILALRQRAMDRLGERFDIREFHDVVLGNGAVPLSILERLVDEWITRESGGPE